MIVTCKKWHVAKRLLDRVGSVSNLPAIEYLFDEEAIRIGSFATQTVARRPTGYGQRWPIQQRLLGVSASYRF